MPQVDLSPLESQVVLLALQKKRDAEQAATAQFLTDVALVRDAHQMPLNADVRFRITQGVGVASWPDATPQEDV